MQATMMLLQGLGWLAFWLLAVLVVLLVLGLALGLVAWMIDGTPDLMIVKRIWETRAHSQVDEGKRTEEVRPTGF